MGRVPADGPAPGVDANALAKSLTKQGVKGVQSSAAAPAATCSYGTARTLRCPMPRWSYSGHNHPHIYFLDHTSSSWPMTTIVPTWNNVEGMDSWYRWYTKGCPSSTVHCVHVYSGSYGKTGWTGRTTWTTNSAGTYFKTAKVQLNNSYGGTASEKKGTTCHEAGHVLGLGHNTSTGSCLYYKRVSGRSTTPKSNDYTLLEKFY